MILPSLAVSLHHFPSPSDVDAFGGMDCAPSAEVVKDVRVSQYLILFIPYSFNAIRRALTLKCNMILTRPSDLIHTRFETRDEGVEISVYKVCGFAGPLGKADIHDIVLYGTFNESGFMMKDCIPFDKQGVGGKRKIPCQSRIGVFRHEIVAFIVLFTDCKGSRYFISPYINQFGQNWNLRKVRNVFYQPSGYDTPVQRANTLYPSVHFRAILGLQIL